MQIKIIVLKLEFINSSTSKFFFLNEGEKYNFYKYNNYEETILFHINIDKHS